MTAWPSWGLPNSVVLLGVNNVLNLALAAGAMFLQRKTDQSREGLFPGPKVRVMEERDGPSKTQYVGATDIMSIETWYHSALLPLQLVKETAYRLGTDSLTRFGYATGTWKQIICAYTQYNY